MRLFAQSGDRERIRVGSVGQNTVRSAVQPSLLIAARNALHAVHATRT